jgi:8-oxo-dGTP pyrophosphatase MutT (NUDIX family)
MSGIYCNNCGSPGHSFNNCRYPITSLGIICCKYINNDKKYLLIRRKDTLGYVEFIRGKYPINNKLYIQTIIDEMTIDEKDKLLKHNFDTLWNDLWGGQVGIQYRSEEKISRNKFELLSDGLMYDGELFTIQSFISHSKTKWDEPEWGFPKGRRNFKEKELVCALREFQEETGYHTDVINIIQNIQPLQEIFTGSNYKSYKHSYYIAIMDNNNDESNPSNITYPKYQKSEVSAIKWMTYEEACKKIRPYNLERINIMRRVNTLLSEYTIYK